MQHAKRAILLPILLLLAGCAQMQPAVLGVRPVDAKPTPIASLKPSQAPQTIAGTMIDKCPIAGCWFRVKDNTGVVKVDTKNAGFVVSSIPLGTHVVVAGKYRAGDDCELLASGMSYR